MKLADIKPGMKLKAVGDYGGCIVTGDEFTAYELDGGVYVSCRGPDGSLGQGGCHHELASTATKGEIPELELAEVPETPAQCIGGHDWEPRGYLIRCRRCGASEHRHVGGL